MNEKDHHIIPNKKHITPHPKLEQVTIPTSSTDKIVIPCNLSGYGFMLIKNEDYSLDDIPIGKLNKTIRKINKKIDIILIKKKIEETTDYNATNLLLQKVLFGLGVFTAFVMYLMALYEVDDFKENLIFIPLIVILLVVIGSLFIMMKGLMTRRHFIDLDAEIATMLETELEKENESYFQQRGYLLDRGVKFCWLEVRKVF